MTFGAEEDPRIYIQQLIDESMAQFYRSRLRAEAIEAFAYIAGGIWTIATLVVAFKGIVTENVFYYIVSAVCLFFAFLAYFVISAFAHILGNSSQKLRLSAFDFILTHDPYDP